jgi:hypothetical protein
LIPSAEAGGEFKIQPTKEHCNLFEIPPTEVGGVSNFNLTLGGVVGDYPFEDLFIRNNSRLRTFGLISLDNHEIFDLTTGSLRLYQRIPF